MLRSSHRRYSVTKGVLRNFAKFRGKHLCQILSFHKVAEAFNFIKKENLAKVFSCEFCEISKNTFCYRTPQPATLLKKTLWHRCFPVNFTKFLRTLFDTEHIRWLLLYVQEEKLQQSKLES